MLHIHFARRSFLGRLAGCMLAAVSCALCAMPASAQEAWPSKQPIKLIVPGAPGGGPDIIARLVADKLSQSLKQSVVVDNKPGANGTLAGLAVKSAPADGYTLLFTPAAFTVAAQAFPKRLPYDVIADFAPVTQVGAGGVYLVATPDFPANTLKEFIALVKANPGKFDYASFGIGSTGHLIMSSMEHQLGLDIRHIPYKSIPQIYQNLQGGMIKLAWVDSTSSTPLLKANKIKAIAVSGSARTIAVPTVPTMTEQGFKFDTDGWYGVLAPKGTPADIVNTLNKEINKILVSPELTARWAQFNLSNPPLRTPEQFGQVMRDDLKVWSKIVKDGNITAED